MPHKHRLSNRLHPKLVFNPVSGEPDPTHSGQTPAANRHVVCRLPITPTVFSESHQLRSSFGLSSSRPACHAGDFLQISVIIIGGPGGGKRCPVFCAGWPVDAHSVPRCHIELCGPRKEQPRADWLLFSAGRQCPSSSQCGSGSVDGHSTVTYSCLLQSDCWGKLLSEETSYTNGRVNQLGGFTPPPLRGRLEGLECCCTRENS